VAIITSIAACYVRWGFSACNYAIVTRATSADDLSMVDGAGRNPDVGGVAVLADIARLNVCEILARRIVTVVAVNAVIGDTYVIEVRR